MAGRPKGKKDLAPRMTGARRAALVHVAKVNGLTPLKVMLEDMERKYRAGDLEAAATRAETCAPYIHARLASTTVTHRDAIDELSLDELRSLLAAAERAAGSVGREIEGEALSEVEGEQDIGLPALH